MDCRKISEALSRMIRPQSHPLGLKLLKAGETLPEGAVRPAKYGIRISLCQWTTMARRWGRVLGATAADINCAGCLAALGFKALKDPGHLAAYLMDMGYFSDAEGARRAVAEMGLIPPGKIAAVTLFPLDLAPVSPDVIVVYGTPAQMARLAAGYVYHGGELIASKTTGFGLSCLSAVKPHFTGKPALVHPGRGERMLAGTDEWEMFFTFPADRAESLLDGLEKTQEKGTRYPVQSYLLYEPPVIDAMRRLEEKLSDL